MPIIAKSGNDLNAAILIAWGAHPQVRLWRANAGQAWVPIPGGARPIQMNVPGCADLIGILGPHGRFLAIETKSANDDMRETQRRFRTMIEARGGLYIVARSVEDVDRVLGPLCY